MVMENQEMVMEKSWKNTLSSLWEPWYMYCFHSVIINLYNPMLNVLSIPLLFIYSTGEPGVT